MKKVQFFMLLLAFQTSFLFAEGTWTSIPYPEGIGVEEYEYYITKNTIRLAANSKGSVWIVTPYETSFYEYKNNIWKSYTSENIGGFDLSGVYGYNDILFDKKGTVWFATSNNGLNAPVIINYNGLVWNIYTFDLSTDGAISSKWKGSVLSIAEDEEGVIWGAGDSGVVRINPDSSWNIYTLAGSDSLSGMRSVSVDADNVKWFAGDKGIFRFDGSEWKKVIIPSEVSHVTLGTGISVSYVSFIASDKNGRFGFSVATIGAWKGMYSNDSNSFTYIPLCPLDITSLMCDRNGTFWIGAYHIYDYDKIHRFVFDGVKWYDRSAESGWFSNIPVFMDIYVDDANRKWFACSKIIWMYDDNESAGIGGKKPQSFSLDSCPNPFNPATTLSVNLTESGSMNLDIYAASGQKIRHLSSGGYAIGNHRFIWDGKNDRGEAVASGVYIARVRMGNQAISKKMLLLR